MKESDENKGVTIMTKEEREEYRRAQQRKKKRLEEGYPVSTHGKPKRKPTGSNAVEKNAAGKAPKRKSSAQGGMGNGRPTKNSAPRSSASKSSMSRSGMPKNSTGHKGKKNGNKTAKTVGLVLAGIEGIASVVFMIALFVLGMLPSTYLVLIGTILLVVFGGVLASQLLSKKKGIAGKVISVIMSIILLIGSFYVFRTNGAVAQISGGGSYKLDNMVVAVLTEDPAQSIQDAADYSYGVQYAMNGDQVRETVSSINEELGREIAVVEYASLAEQATALHNGEVNAIIYNEGYTGILEEAFEGYSANARTIYSHEIRTEVENTAEEVPVDSTFTVFISGIDVYGAIETNSRSDVNIMAVVNPESHQVLLVNTPRDYYVEIPGITGGQRDKLTHAGIYGVDASMATLGQLYDTDINFYARVNFTSLIDIVDALGGVDVYSEQAFTTSEDSDLVMNVVQGENHFNGQQALAFSRERQNIDGGDNQRGKNQQAVITAMIQKMVSPAILAGANGIISSVSGNVDTNMSQDQIQELIRTQLSDGAAWNIKSMQATGAGDEQYCYSYSGSPLYVTQPDQASIDAIKQAIAAVHNGDVLEDAVVAQ